MSYIATFSLPLLPPHVRSCRWFLSGSVVFFPILLSVGAMLGCYIDMGKTEIPLTFLPFFPSFSFSNVLGEKDGSERAYGQFNCSPAQGGVHLPEGSELGRKGGVPVAHDWSLFYFLCHIWLSVFHVQILGAVYELSTKQASKRASERARRPLLRTGRTGLGWVGFTYNVAWE